MRDAGDRVVRSYGVLTDIDDRKRAERRLRRAMRARYEAVLAERMRIARDVHDGLLQDISGLALQLGAALHDEAHRVTAHGGLALSVRVYGPAPMPGSWPSHARPSPSATSIGRRRRRA